MSAKDIVHGIVRDDIYHNFFQDIFIQKVIDNYSIKSLIINPQQGEIILWKPSLINN